MKCSWLIFVFMSNRPLHVLAFTKKIQVRCSRFTFCLVSFHLGGPVQLVAL